VKGAAAARRTEVYTDGGARPNPGPGGWGVVLLRPGAEPAELSGGADHTTNNRMELTAAIHALEALRVGEAADVHTDSLYLRKGVTEWLPGWIARGWKRKSGAVENEDLWRRLDALDRRRDVAWHWLRGHAGHRWNERADALASAEVRRHGGEADGRAVAAVPAVDREIFLRISCASGRGGWAAAVREPGEASSEETVSGRVARTTPNRVDLEAAAALLEAQPEGSRIALFSASDYLRNGASQWIHGWRKRNWTTRDGKPVANRDLWERLSRAIDRHAAVHWPPAAGEAAEVLEALEPRAKEARSGG
jgi:ribonuclease HI